ncbi:UNKNOWN [Stylonychia lemnae]|uniref:Uncharacterized protein n=1 Tax=Stylonychia lemnae TaxID=5949 RepID=A0A078APB4_STYLE|nr:UNKNOWN [Stylonychia lemnae]|eukprot:CDW83781.1 UNKNOWN [Stylonychia lemnae]
MGGGNSKKAKKGIKEEDMVRSLKIDKQFPKDPFTNLNAPNVAVPFEEKNALPTLQTMNTPKNEKGKPYGILKNTNETDKKAPRYKNGYIIDDVPVVREKVSQGQTEQQLVYPSQSQNNQQQGIKSDQNQSQDQEAAGEIKPQQMLQSNVIVKAKQNQPLPMSIDVQFKADINTVGYKNHRRGKTYISQLAGSAYEFNSQATLAGANKSIVHGMVDDIRASQDKGDVIDLNELQSYISKPTKHIMF